MTVSAYAMFFKTSFKFVSNCLSKRLQIRFSYVIFVALSSTICQLCPQVRRQPESRIVGTVNETPSSAQ